MTRCVTLEQTFEDDVDVEHTAELEVRVTEGTPETRFEPAYPGDVEPLRLRVDAAEISDWSGWQWLIDELLARPIPKPDYLEDPR